MQLGVCPAFGAHSTPPAKRTEIDGGPADNLPGSIDDDAESSIAAVERQPVKPGVLANAVFASGGNLAGPKQDQHATDLYIEARGDDRSFDLVSAVGYLDDLWGRAQTLWCSIKRDNRNWKIGIAGRRCNAEWLPEVQKRSGCSRNKDWLAAVRLRRNVSSQRSPTCLSRDG